MSWVYGDEPALVREKCHYVVEYHYGHDYTECVTCRGTNRRCICAGSGVVFTYQDMQEVSL